MIPVRVEEGQAPAARSFSFLVNPTAGGGAAPGAVVPVARLLREAGARVDVTYSPGPDAMAALVAAAVGRGDVVVAVGGDGMLSSVAGLVAAADGTLGILPAGRGNDFARVLGVPGDVEGRARLLLEGRVRRLDLLALTLPDAVTPAGSQAGSSAGSAAGSQAGSSAGPRLVAGSVYAGVDARAAEIVDASRRVPRRLQYPLAALRALATYRPAHYRLVVDGVVRELDAATVVVANSACYGQGMRIAPDARVDDGRLDVVVIEAASRLELMRSLPKVYDGSHVLLPEVTVLTGHRVELSADPADAADAADAADPADAAAGAGSAVPLGGDGEPLGTLPALGAAPAVVDLLPAALAAIW